MKSIGIVICNYNKCEYVLKCIQSVLESNMQDFDLFVADNASTDDSVSGIRKTYGDRVQIIENKENLGGSGGFNAGLRKAAELGYEYVMCLDNDVQVDENAVEALYTFLQEHPEVGMVGSKVYHLQAPDYIQQFGLKINFDKSCAETLYADVPDSGDIPEIVYCDTVAACSVMLPMKVVREVGVMPEDNFIYWDDMEWGYRIKQAGYQVAAYGASRVVHEMGAFSNKKTTFCYYYQMRNSMNFFMKYTPEDKLEKMSINLLSSLFSTVYETMYRNEHNAARTLMYAYYDSLARVRGKAGEGKILPNTEAESQWKKIIQSAGSYWLAQEDTDIEEQIRSLNPAIRKAAKPDKVSLKIVVCDNLMRLSGKIEDGSDCCYVDREGTAAYGREDLEIIRNYPFSLQLFLYMNQEPLLNISHEIQKGIASSQ